MSSKKDLEYSRAVTERLKYIMELIGLEIPGFAIFINKSESHVYSILNGSRDLTTDLANFLGNKLDFDGNKIFKLNYEIPETIKKAKSLRDFKMEYSNNIEYFSDTKIDRKLSYFLEFELLKTKIFDQPKYLWEIRRIVKESGREYTSDQLSKALNYLVAKKRLKSKKERIKLKGGGFGTRIVDVFWK